MEIIYPPLVEEGLKYYLETTQQSLDKSTFYRSMVERGIITETGLPTQQAIENGLVKDYYEDQVYQRLCHGSGSFVASTR